MLAEHGSFEAMEIQIKKTLTKSQSEKAGGGWYTALYLKTKENWTKS